jgi:hypothetical protein
MSKLEILREQGSASGRYLIRIDGQLTEAELTWVRLGPKIIVAEHTLVPGIYQGLGFGMMLIEHLVQDARARGTHVVPLCPFVRSQYQQHPEWDDVFSGPPPD